MGYIYEAMDQAKEHIKETYKYRVYKYGPIWEIIDRRWNNQLHHPIHAAGYFLNPRYQYRDHIDRDPTREVVDGLYSYLERMVQMRRTNWRYIDKSALSPPPQVPLPIMWLRFQETWTNQVNISII